MSSPETAQLRSCSRPWSRPASRFSARRLAPTGQISGGREADDRRRIQIGVPEPGGKRVEPRARRLGHHPVERDETCLGELAAIRVGREKIIVDLERGAVGVEEPVGDRVALAPLCPPNLYESIRPVPIKVGPADCPGSRCTPRPDLPVGGDGARSRGAFAARLGSERS